MPFGWGIVSTGKHPDVKIAPAMAAADGGELVGVYSRDQHRAEAFAQKHGARAAYSQLGDLLKDSRVDGVFVSSPNALHAEHVVQAAEVGKHVLCEKPMATTIDDAVRMLQACRRAGVTLGVAFNLRQHPAISARASSSLPGRWAASCSPRRSGRSACAAATARRRARRSPSGGTRRT
jgi:1,5-anhydro-D-fructose reductase (1,5-anhydro-D-mannitol-forming)